MNKSEICLYVNYIEINIMKYNCIYICVCVNVCLSVYLTMKYNFPSEVSCLALIFFLLKNVMAHNFTNLHFLL